MQHLREFAKLQSSWVGESVPWGTIQLPLLVGMSWTAEATDSGRGEYCGSWDQTSFWYSTYVNKRLLFSLKTTLEILGPAPSLVPYTETQVA